MATWNHRVIQKYNESFDETYFEIHEVHYGDDGSIWAMTENPTSPFGETIEELQECLEQMKRACDATILIEGEIKFTPIDEQVVE